jgi:hypothetical protein
MRPVTKCSPCDIHTNRRSFSGSLFALTAVACRPSQAFGSSPNFSLDLPKSFVRLSAGGTASPDVLLSAGDFRGMIAATGAATTISVQRIYQPTILPSSAEASPTAAAALARLRDSQSGLPSGCISQVIGSTVVLDDRGLGFEFLTPLTGNGLDPKAASPDLVRHSLVRVASAADGVVLVLWAGARSADWDAGAGNELREAANTFAATPPSR